MVRAAVRKREARTLGQRERKIRPAAIRLEIAGYQPDKEICDATIAAFDPLKGVIIS